MSVHAAAAHFPLALGLVWPWVDLAGFVLRRPPVSWTAVALLSTAMVVSVVSTATGQTELDAAFAAGVDIELLQSHGDLAATVPWALAGVLALRIYLPTKLGRIGHGLGWALGLASGLLLLQVGQTGGALVYEHGVGIERAAEGE